LVAESVVLLSPYRSIVRRASQVADRYRQLGDLDLLPVFALLWLVSAAVVVGHLLRRDAFGPEETVALAVVIALPWLMAAPKPARPRSQKP
jgi:hypothetical protein